MWEVSSPTYVQAREKNLILLEAYHYQFHPAVHEFSEFFPRSALTSILLKTDDVPICTEKLVSDPSRGRLLKTYAEMTMPAGNTDDSDVRHQYSLGGGVSNIIYYRSTIRR